MMGLTLLDKIWSARAIVAEGDEALVYVDRTLVHEGSFHAFDLLSHDRRSVRRPDLTFGFADHYVPTVDRDAGLAAIRDDEAREVVAALERNASAHRFQSFGMTHPRQGIVHVVAPELGLIQPGALVICNDSHTSTHG